MNKKLFLFLFVVANLTIGYIQKSYAQRGVYGGCYNGYCGRGFGWGRGWGYSGRGYYGCGCGYNRCGCYRGGPWGYSRGWGWRARGIRRGAPLVQRYGEPTMTTETK